MQYIRFVIRDVVDPDTHHPLGVFQAAYELLDEEPALTNQHRAALRETLDWFNEHLALPQRFARSRKPNAAPGAISWLKLDASEHIARIRTLCDVIALYRTVHEVRTNRPGYVTHDDTFQVIAEPFTDTFQRGIWKQYTSPQSAAES